MVSIQVSARDTYLQQLRAHLERCRAECDPAPLAQHSQLRSEREFTFQVQVLGERVQQLGEYIAQITAADERHWRFLTCDAERACEALTLSLQYFRGLTRLDETTA